MADEAGAPPAPMDIADPVTAEDAGSRGASAAAQDESAGAVLYAFGATWSVPWRLLAGELAELAGDPLAECQVRVVDVDAEPALADRWRVVSIPTFLVLERGEEKRRVVGAVSAGELTALATLGAAAKAGRTGMRQRRH